MTTNRITRRQFVTQLGLGAAAVATAGCLARQPPGPALAQRPNLLFIMSDQHRGDFLGCAGHPLMQTPSLDRLAAQGTRFDRAYTSWPLCVPARMSLITGRYPHSHGAPGNIYALPPTEQTIGHYLKGLGYRTAAVGKMHFQDADQNHGFDYRIERPDFEKEAGVQRRAHTERSRDGKDWGIAPWSEAETYEHYVADKTIAWLEGHREQPFCAWCSFSAPHPPYLAAPELFDLYAGKVHLPPQNPNDKTAGEYSEADALTILTAYMANITLVDRNLGRVLAALNRLGLADRTIVVYTSDHGEMAYQRHRFGKGVMYEGATHIPLILRAPARVPHQVVRREVVEHVDLFPTFCELLNVPTPKTVQGRSLLPLLSGQAADWPNTAFIEQNNRRVTVVHGSYKCSFPRGKADELYCLETNPQEWNNLIGEPGSDKIVADLRKLMDDWRARTPDSTAPIVPTRKLDRKGKADSE